LPLTKLRAKLATRIRGKQLARIEPVRRGCALEDGRERSAELGDVGATVVPEGGAVRNFGKTENLFDAAVAVGSHDQNPSRHFASGVLGDFQNHVVVKLALHPVRDELVPAEAPRHFFQQRPQNELTCKAFDDCQGFLFS
jgi:hypothetical protein